VYEDNSTYLQVRRQKRMSSMYFHDRLWDNDGSPMTKQYKTAKQESGEGSTHEWSELQCS